MKWVLAFAIAVFLAAAAAAQPAEDFDAVSTDQLIETAPSAHPATLYMLSARLLGEGNGLEAANWMYAGQLRYRFMIAALGEEKGTGDHALFSALSESVGRPVNEYIAGDPDEWIAAMEWALEWDAAHDNPFTSKIDHASELAAVRSGLEGLIVEVDANRQYIRDTREAQGLPNR
ncbi:hypothetical protein [Pelagibacterium xiamenense]|uniref:hypothetical protein n=1 Tax=Pelagibacterium xiamenense TaxID=2901140 RepID=UPI001E5877F0|nr:hypothetical protein [Pelagibacterium xiamenense]MCD7061399.1 hypothetical protein [Pelagibacterium xiamenense]